MRLFPTASDGKSNSITLADGTVITVENWVHGNLMSALVIDGNTEVRNYWELFAYSRGSKIPNTNITAGREHTTVPRSGDSGLPKDWEMLVTSWRAVINVPLEQPVLDWAGATSVVLQYNGKHYGLTTLLDLLMAERRFDTVGPVHMRESLQYGVTVDTPPDATRKLQAWLKRDAFAVVDTFQTAVHELDVLAGLVANGPVSDRLRGILKTLQPMPIAAIKKAVDELDVLKDMVDGAIQDRLKQVVTKLQPQRSITAWVHLEGPMKRTVI